MRARRAKYGVGESSGRGGVEERGEGEAEMFAGAIEAGFNGFGGAMEDLADFRVGEFFEFGKEEWGAQFFREGVDGLTDDLGAVVGIEFLVGLGARIGESAFEGFAALGIVGFEGDLGVAGAVAEAIFDEVCGDGEEPGGEAMAGIEMGAILIDADEGLLGEIGGVLGILEGAEQVMEEPGSVALHQAVQSWVMTLSQPAHVGGVRVMTC